MEKEAISHVPLMGTRFFVNNFFEHSVKSTFSEIFVFTPQAPSELDFSLLQYCCNSSNSTFDIQHSTVNTTVNTTNDSDGKKPSIPYKMTKNEVKKFALPKPPIWRSGARQTANLSIFDLKIVF